MHELSYIHAIKKITLVERVYKSLRPRKATLVRCAVINRAGTT